MPIEFRCQHCGKLLRVGDETAGKQAKCPSCGAVQTIPAASPAGEQPSLPPIANPFGSAPNAPFGELGPEYQSDNPYASPPSPMFTSGEASYESAGGPRSGPPWEREGASIGSYFATVRETFASANLMYSEMRRTGGLGPPLLYGLAGGMAWGVIGLALQLGIQSLMMGMAGAQGAGAGPNFAPAMFFGVGFAAALIALPIGIVISMFMSAGICHLMLMMLSAAKRPFETTFRVVAYASGSSSIFSAIPICGAYAQWIAQLVFTGIGLCRAHEISGGKAAAAVVLPLVVCCGGMIVIYAVFIGAIVAGAR